MSVIRANEVIIGNNSPETTKLGHAIPKYRLLDDTELNAVTGGSGVNHSEVNHSEFSIVKLLDAATPKLF